MIDTATEAEYSPALSLTPTYKCIENYTVAEFRDCIEKIRPRSPLLKVNFEAYEYKIDINAFGLYDILFPSDGSISSDPNLEPSLLLEPLLEYSVFLFDKNYMFPFYNPLTVKSSCLITCLLSNCTNLFHHILISNYTYLLSLGQKG